LIKLCAGCHEQIHLKAGDRKVRLS
jgi:hypothetical protein